ncbi:RNA polymerase, sigma-24 subunit, ECF subfamily [Thalassotalea sp. ND16A]|nr:RNA polymerase, sigma-24 subunit, ECF subfamily [Thalassotalea sp. ND16A]
MFFKSWRSQSTLEQQLQTHLPMLERIVASYEAIPAIQQELMQEVVLAIWSSFDKFKGDSAMKTYFARIAHNRCISHVDKAVKNLAEQELSEHVCQSAFIDEQLSEQQKYQQLLAQIRQLPTMQKQVISLFLEGFSYQQIADVCGLTTSNVGVMLNRIKQQLSQFFTEESS